MKSPRIFAALVVAACLAGPAFVPGAAAGAPADWPREFDTASGAFIIYEPQPEDLQGDLLTGRAAFSLQKTADENPTFGVLWFTARIEVDRDSSVVTERDLDVTRVRLPQITPEQANEYESLVENEARRWDLSGSLDELRAGLAAAEKERASVDDLDHTAPRIRFVNQRAILVVFDGAPALEPIEGSSLQYAANTPYAIVYDPASRTYYLNGANLWYRARDPLGPWTRIAAPPRAVADVMPPDTASTDQVQGPAPLVLTATEPTELIASDGPPRYAPLVGDELLYMTNTESDVLRDVSTQSIYVLLSGRWYRARSQNGPWTFVRGDELPPTFRQIPPDSPKGHLLASVAGTDQADDAVADAEIPQTSAVSRDAEAGPVTYDGSPEFDPIEGTDLQYAVNSDAEVILADGRYYLCDQGVWYVADDPNGPWTVSETRPLGLDDLPPSCPVYDTRYVYVFSYTPDVVYVGYLPGYVGCYPYYGTVVYGTGYHYRAWRSRRHYFPRPHTWGFHARYNPWLSRWSFGTSYGVGFLRVGSRWQPAHEPTRHAVRSKWFGAGGYRRPLLTQDLAFLRTPRQRPRVQDRLPVNLYSRPENVARIDRSAIRMPVRPLARPATRPAPLPNDVFAGRDGKVYQRDPRGTWKVNEGRLWRPAPVPRSNPPGESRDRSGTGGTMQRRGSWPNFRPVTPAPSPAPARPTPETRPAPSPAPARPTPGTRPAPSPEPARPAPETRPAPSPAPARPAPEVRPAPGDLERVFRARERAGSQQSPAPQPERQNPPARESERRPGFKR